jgi:hypothetical protein
MIYLIYKTDVHHSYASRDLIGISTNDSSPISIIKQQVEKEGEDLSSDDLYNLSTIKQTQGYEGEGEFDYESVETDILL